MAATGFLVFYRFKTMSKEEAQKAKEEWQNLKNGLPSGIELVGEYTHAWGTEYNGFLLFESDSADSIFRLVVKFQGYYQMVCGANTYNSCKKKIAFINISF
jgi:hypothetical protein